jgi:hypothetical protein
MHSFFAFLFKVRKKCYYGPKFFFHENINMGTKNAEFYADFKFVDADLKKFPKKSYSQKTMQILSILVFAHFFVVF